MSSELSTQEPSVALMLRDTLSTVRDGQITPAHVEVLKGMMDLYERNERRQGEKDFAAALTDLQGETIRVHATKAVDQKADGTCRYKFAPYEEIMREVQPMLTKHGFSVTFDTRVEENRLVSVCTLTHKGGHTRQNSFAVRYTKPPGSSDAQGDMSTKSYAKRGALCDALNITIDHDDDARALGDFISAQDADNLREWVESLGADVKKFLEFAEAESFETIRTSKLDVLHDTLKKREAKAK